MTDVCLILIMQTSSSRSSSDDFPFQDGYLVLLVEDPADDGITTVNGLFESVISSGRLAGSLKLVSSVV